MKKKLQRKLRLARPSDAFLPAALLAASLCGHGETAAALYLAKLLTHTLALAAPEATRAAFAVQPSIKGVRGSVKLALLLQILATALAFAGAGFLRGGLALIPLAMLIAAGALLNVEHTFYEYLFAAGEGASAARCRLITAVLTLAGLLLSPALNLTADDPLTAAWPLGAALLAMLTALTVGLGIGGGLKGRLNAQVLRAAPRALPQSLAFPAFAALAIHFAPFLDWLAAPFFAGSIAYALSRTPFRRAPMEARPLHKALGIAALIAAAIFGASWVPSVRSAVPCWSLVGQCAAMVLLACLCGFALYGNPSKSH